MKKARKAKIFLSLYKFFLVLSFVGLILLLIGKVKTISITLFSLYFSVVFKKLYDYSKKEKIREENDKDNSGN